MPAMLPIDVTQAMRNALWEIECEVTGKSSSGGPYKSGPPRRAIATYVSAAWPLLPATASKQVPCWIAMRGADEPCSTRSLRNPSPKRVSVRNYFH